MNFCVNFPIPFSIKILSRTPLKIVRLQKQCKQQTKTNKQWLQKQCRCAKTAKPISDTLQFDLFLVIQLLILNERM